MSSGRNGRLPRLPGDVSGGSATWAVPGALQNGTKTTRDISLIDYRVFFTYPDARLRHACRFPSPSYAAYLYESAREG